MGSCVVSCDSMALSSGFCSQRARHNGGCSRVDCCGTGNFHHGKMAVMPWCRGQKLVFDSGRASGCADALRVLGDFERGLGGQAGNRGARKENCSKQNSKLTPFPKLNHSGRLLHATLPLCVRKEVLEAIIHQEHLPQAKRIDESHQRQEFARHGAILFTAYSGRFVSRVSAME